MEKAAAGLLPETGLQSVLDINNLVGWCIATSIVG